MDCFRPYLVLSSSASTHPPRSSFSSFLSSSLIFHPISPHPSSSLSSSSSSSISLPYPLHPSSSHSFISHPHPLLTSYVILPLLILHPLFPSPFITTSALCPSLRSVLFPHPKFLTFSRFPYPDAYMRGALSPYHTPHCHPFLPHSHINPSPLHTFPVSPLSLISFNLRLSDIFPLSSFFLVSHFSLSCYSPVSSYTISSFFSSLLSLPSSILSFPTFLLLFLSIPFSFLLPFYICLLLLGP